MRLGIPFLVSNSRLAQLVRECAMEAEIGHSVEVKSESPRSSGASSPLTFGAAMDSLDDGNKTEWHDGEAHTSQQQELQQEHLHLDKNDVADPRAQDVSAQLEILEPTPLELKSGVWKMVVRVIALRGLAKDTLAKHVFCKLSLNNTMYKTATSKVVEDDHGK